MAHRAPTDSSIAGGRMSTVFHLDSPMDRITARFTVNEITERWPAAVPVMREYGMREGCCGGMTLAAVAERSNLDVGRLVEQLREAAER